MAYKKFLIASLLSAVALSMWVPRFTQLEIPESLESGILVCYPESYEGPSGVDDAILQGDYVEYRDKFFDEMAASDDDDSNVIATILAAKLDNNNGLIEPLDSLKVTYPDNQIASLHMLSACTENIDHAACGENVVEQAIYLNDRNAVLWSLVSVYRMKQEDIYGATTALQRAVSVPVYNDYFQTYLRIWQDQIPPGTRYNSTRLRLDLIGYSSVLLFNNTQTITKLCAEFAPERPNLGDACLNFGVRMQNESGTMLMDMIGRAIQVIAHRALGNSAEAERLDQVSQKESRDRSLFRSGYSAFYSAYNRASYLMTYDEQLAEYWLDNFIRFGEIRTEETLVIEARRLSSNPDYAPCNPPGLRFEFPYFFVDDERVVY